MTEVKNFYTLYTVFARNGVEDDFSAYVEEAQQAVDSLKDVTLRGFYDVSAMRADADVMMWIHGEQPEELQAAVRVMRRTRLFADTTIVFSAMGVHRQAEFAKDHIPAYAVGTPPEKWAVVYPFSRTHEWYLLEPAKRAAMLRDHGMMGREYPQVLANTVSAFSLNDWEWMLALEAPELTDLVDMMRHLRNNEARLYTREETPFYTGRLISLEEVADVLS